MYDVSRRRFLGKSTRTVFAMGLGALATRRPILARAASEKVQLAAIGIGGRCSTLLRGFSKRDDVHVRTFCDVYPERKRLVSAAKRLEESQGRAPDVVKEYRRVLDDKDIDAVIVGTPDHWHAPLTIYSCQAGKDVYVEKPPSHNIWEGRKMAEAAARYQRVVQVGTQNRSAPYVLKALDLVQSGALGKVHLCKVFNLKSGGAYHPAPTGKKPASLDFDTWLGPAPERAYDGNVYNGGWHKLWDFSGGDLADDGVHQLDIARMLLGKGFPRDVHATGGNLAFQDGREVPDTQIASYTWPDLIMTCELTQWPRYMEKTNHQTRTSDDFPSWMQNATRIELYGTEKMMVLGRHGGGWQIFTKKAGVDSQMYGRFPDAAHQANFIDCIRTRKTPNAPAEEGHRSATLVHLANISYRLGGRKVTFDAETQTCVGDSEANRLVRREYRKKFEVPEVV